ncbi:MAG: choice-of-anchor I family protein [Cyclobacteriaceae bacterium]|nr:choice-of-anchor I family protein [Cyclobacteriaceae bacterium]
MRRFYIGLLLLSTLFSRLTSEAQTLIHYWNFNNSASVNELLTPTSSLVGSPALTHIAGGISAIQITSNTGQGFDVTNPNARNSDAALTHLRFNDPIGGGLLFSLPTTGYQNVVIKYATRRSGSGAGTQIIEYSTDGSSFVSFGTVSPVDGNPELATLDFSSIPAVDNNANFKIRITFAQGSGGTVGNNRFDNFTTEGSPLPSLSLIHYWNFNNSTNETTLLTASFTAGGATLTAVNGATSVIQATSNTGQGFEIANENARNGDASGSHLRYNNSVDGTLIFALPTTGYENVLVKYTTRRSSAANGAGVQVIDYSTDGSTYINFTSINTDFNGPVLQTLDFSAIAAADNNPNFKIKITFQQGAGGVTGNNRFDNFTMDGYSLSGGDVSPPTVVLSPANNAIDVAVNVTPTLTFNEDIRLIDNTILDNNNVDNVVELRIGSATGASVPFDATIAGKVITMVPTSPLLTGQAYYLAVKANVIEDYSNNALTTITSSTFTTQVPQTTFAAGDIVFVAYRTNASTPDEVAFLTFVNILPGTKINFTDAKFTDNPQPQCAGGFVWTAPATGIAAGSVVTISVDSPFNTSAGSVAGASFGLSSGGEQVIMYTGTAANPSYITALSTNAWLTTTTTTCSGSFSKLPATLVDGQTSINLSAAPGNVSGNTVNAYYAGTQTGTASELRAAILNPANWIGVGSGTPAQQWPTWAFPGPPYVLSASVLNQTSLQIVFSAAVDNATATNLANYSGIAGLQSAVIGVDGKTVILTYATPFVIGSSNTVSVNYIKDLEGRTMFTAYNFSFTYSTFISFDKKFVSVLEDAGSLAVKIKIQNPATSSVELVVKGAPFSTATPNDFTLTSQTLSFDGTSSLEHTITIPILNDNAPEQDEYFVLSLENPSGAVITGGNYMTIFIKDNDRIAPIPNKEIELSYVTSFDPGSSTAEIVVHDPASQRLFVISSAQDRLDIADFSDPTAIMLLKSIDMSPYGGITSVATKNGIVAVASPNVNEQQNGSVVFFNSNGDFQKQVTVGVLPDMIVFSPDGTKVMTANEGQPNDAYTVDPEGSVSIIDIAGGISNLDQSKVTTLLFDGFNSQEATLRAAGVRKLKSTSTLSQDFEPEFITITPDSRTAWVTLQENNAIAEINIETKSITNVWAMGKKDYNAFGNGFDASDNSGIVTIANWPVKAFYIPDAIANYSVGGTQYLVTANEGDEKEYGGLNERTTVGAVTLDPTIFPHAAVLKENHNLGRLRMSNLSGDTDGDGDYDEINVVGARSFTIWNAATKTKVYDSGDDFERYTASEPSVAAIFNADNESNTFKSRSRAKGPEPEGLTLASINGKTYAFIALERVGGVMVYDITNPNDVKFVDYKNSRSLSAFEGDHGPEGIIYIAPENSPNGKAYIAVANEISGTVSLFEITPTPKRDQTITFGALADKVVGDAPFTLSATASSLLPVTYMADGNEVTIAGNQVTIVKAGRISIKANQAGNATFNEAPEVTQSFCIKPAKPIITLTGENTESPTLQSSATEGNQWFLNGVLIAGAVNTTYQVSQQGAYTVRASVEECTGLMSTEYPVVITGNHINTKESVHVSPNPADNFVELQLPGTGLKEIRIYQSTGAVQENRTTNAAIEKVDIQMWSSGIYLIQLRANNTNYFTRFIKK